MDKGSLKETGKNCERNLTGTGKEGLIWPNDTVYSVYLGSLIWPTWKVRVTRFGNLTSVVKRSTLYDNWRLLTKTNFEALPKKINIHIKSLVNPSGRLIGWHGFESQLGLTESDLVVYHLNAGIPDCCTKRNQVAVQSNLYQISKTKHQLICNYLIQVLTYYLPHVLYSVLFSRAV